MRSLIFMFILVCFTISSCKETTDANGSSSEEKSTQTETTEVDGKTILFFGNSLTAGYGLDITEAFPALISKKLDSLNLNYEVINAGNSGETTSGGLNRIEWILKQEVDIFVLELGANDGLRGIPLNETKGNLQDIINYVRQKNPDIKIILAGMQLPPNLGPEYTQGFKEIYIDLANENNIELIPFLLEGVGGIPSLNQGDGIHPTAEGHKILAENVWQVLKDEID